MMADELLNAQDLITAKKHDTFHSEVITGKTGGLSIGANIDYATNAVTGQVQKTLPKILDDLDWSYVGLFADGVTFTDKTDFAVDAVGTQWIYTGSLPFSATAGTVPSEPTYQAVRVNSLQQLSGLTEPSDLDQVHTRTFANVDAMLAFNGLVVGQKCSTGNTYWIVKSLPATSLSNYECLSSFVSAGDLGFTYDGITDNLAKFNASKAALVPIGLGIDFDDYGVVYISSNRPDLSGIRIKANDGMRIKVDQSPNVKDMLLVTPLRIENTGHNTNIVKGANVTSDYQVAAGAAYDLDSSTDRVKRILWNDPSVQLAGYTIGTGKTAFTGALTGTDAATVMYWPVSFANGLEGAFVRSIEDGVLYEAAYRHIGAAVTNNSAYRSVGVLTSKGLVLLSVYVNQVLAKFADFESGSPLVDVPLTNGSYSLSTDGSCVLGVRFVGKSVEFYVNSVIFYKFEVSGDIQEAVFLSANDQSSKCQINSLTSSYVKRAVNHTPTSAAVIGDSISDGAWATKSYDSIMQDAMYGTGVGVVTIENYAVSGTSTAAWAAGGSYDVALLDLSDKDYTLVMLGTNDIQGDVTGGTYEANMTYIIDNIISQGSIPVLGVPPMFIPKGTTGVVTQNFAKGAWIRQLSRALAGKYNIPLADVCRKLGNNFALLGDNIHPTEQGLVLIASSFAEAISNHKSGKIVSTFTYSAPLLLKAGFTSVGDAEAIRAVRDGAVIKLGGTVELTGVATNIAVLPVRYRPKYRCSFMCAVVDTTTNTTGFARVTVETNGNVDLSYSSVANTKALFLDGVTFVADNT